MTHRLVCKSRNSGNVLPLAFSGVDDSAKAAPEKTRGRYRPLIAGGKNQRTWFETPASRRFAFSKPIFERLIRENAFESGYREPALGGIAWSLRKALMYLDCRRLPERLAGKSVIFSVTV